MDLNYIAALITLALVFGGMLINARKIVQGQIEATLSTWLIFISASSMGFASYLVSSHNDFLGGVLNGADLLADLVVLICIVLFSSAKWSLKSFEKYYLVGLIIIALFWFFTHNAFVSNLFLQILTSYAYVPTIHRIIKSKFNTESFIFWILNFVASVVSIYPGYYSWQTNGHILGFIYSVRSAASIALLITVMFVFRSKKLA